MTRTSFAIASLVCLCLAAPGFAQNSESNNQTSQKNQNTQKNNRQQASQQRVADVSLEEGQTISIPAGNELLQLTVAVPKSVVAGQQYRYRARVTNVSDSTTLTNVKLVQSGNGQVEIEQSQPPQDKQSNKSSQASQQSNESSQQQKNNSSSQTSQQGNKSSQQQGNQKSKQQNSQMASWNLGELKPGESKDLTVTAIASATGRVNHCFSVKYDESFCTVVEVVKPKVEIVKSGPDRAVVCEPFEYRYEVTNTGTGPAKDFIVRDQLADGLMTESGKKTLEFRVPELEEGQTEAYVATVHAMQEGDYSSRARVEQQSGETHLSKQVSTQIVAPSLDVAISGPRAFKAGEGGNYDVTVSNSSDVPAQNVYLTLSPGSNANISNAGSADAREGGKAYRYNLGTIDPNQKQTVSVSIDSQKEGSVTLDARAVALCESDTEKTVAQAEANLQAKVLRITSLLLTVVDMDDVIATGETVTYRVRVKNQGDYKDQNVKVDLQLPNGLNFERSEGRTKPQADGNTVTLGPVKTIEPGQMLEWLIVTNGEQAGEQIVKAKLDSDALEKSVNAEEVTTFYDASQQKTSGQKTQRSGNSNQNRSNNNNNNN